MSFTLVDKFNDSFEYKDKIFNLNMAFDNILLLYEMFDDDELEEYEKVFVTMKMLIIEYEELDFDSHEELYDLFKFILNEFLGINLDKSDDPKDDHIEQQEYQQNEIDENDNEQQTIKVYDFKKDASLIYASFFAAYKIDLFEMQGRLHWKKFLSLFENLDDNSPFKKVVGYRTMKVPSEKESSREYINHIRKMKRLYSLDEDKMDINDMFDSISQMLRR